jgi:hypothetical protein
MKLFGWLKKEPKTDENMPLDRDKDGNKLFKEDILKMVADELARRKEERRPLELQWTLNANFLAGHQYCDINPNTGEIENYAPLYEYQSRGIYNRIASLIETRMAHLKSLKYLMTVNPRTNELDDFEKSEISTKLLRYVQSTSEFQAKYNTMIQWAELCGTAFVLSWWDVDKGAEVARVAEICVDENGEETIRERILHEGDLCYGLLTPYEVYPESIYKQYVRDQNSIIVCQVMTVGEIYDLYGVEVDGQDVDTYALTPVEGGGGHGYITASFALTYRKAANSANVVTYFEKPSRRYPDGRLAIVIQDKLIHYGPLPYDEIPLVAVKCKDVAGQFFGRSVIQDLIPLQRAYNGCKNKIHDYIQTLAANPMLAPAGSVEDLERFEDEGIPPGSIIEYTPDRGKPNLLQYNPLPSEVSNEAERLARDMEYVAGVSQLMVTGDTPAGITSGVAIENLRQIDSTRMSLTGENFRNAIRQLAIIWLKILKRFVKGYRVTCIAGSNSVGSVLTWCSEDINSFDVEYDTENELVLSEAAQRQYLIDALNLGLLNDEQGRLPRETKLKLLEVMKVGNYSDIMGEGELQVLNARRENSFFENCVIPKVYQYDDHEIHLREHRRYVLQMKFRILRQKKPEYAALMDEHIAAHEAEIAKRVQNAILQQQMLGGMGQP